MNNSIWTRAKQDFLELNRGRSIRFVRFARSDAANWTASCWWIFTLKESSIGQPNVQTQTTTTIWLHFDFHFGFCSRILLLLFVIIVVVVGYLSSVRIIPFCVCSPNRLEASKLNIQWELRVFLERKTKASLRVAMRHRKSTRLQDCAKTRSMANFVCKLPIEFERTKETRVSGANFESKHK